MNQKSYPDEKKYAEALAKLLQNGASYLEVQASWQQTKGFDSNKIRKHLQKLVSKDVLIQHDLEVALEAYSYENIQVETDANFREMLNEIHTNLEKQGRLEIGKQGKIIPLISKYRWLAAAIFVGLLGTVIVWRSQHNISNESLFAQHFSPLPETTSSHIEKELSGFGLTTNTERLEDQLTSLKAYNEGNFDKAIIELEAYFEKYPNADFSGDDDLKLYLAISYLSENEADTAIKLLIALTNNADFIQQKNAQWYLAMAYLKQADFEKTKDLVLPFAQDSNSIYQSEAKELLEKLE